MHTGLYGRTSNAHTFVWPDVKCTHVYMTRLQMHTRLYGPTSNAHTFIWPDFKCTHVYMARLQMHTSFHVAYVAVLKIVPYCFFYRYKDYFWWDLTEWNFIFNDYETNSNIILVGTNSAFVRSLCVKNRSYSEEIYLLDHMTFSHADAEYRNRRWLWEASVLPLCEQNSIFSVQFRLLASTYCYR